MARAQKQLAEEYDDPDLALNAIKLERRAPEAIRLGLPELDPPSTLPPLSSVENVMTAEPKPDVVAGMKALQSDLGDDLAKQVYADASASDRQTTRNHFEARMEYVRQVAQNSLAAENSVKEYGLQ